MKKILLYLKEKKMFTSIHFIITFIQINMNDMLCVIIAYYASCIAIINPYVGPGTDLAACVTNTIQVLVFEMASDIGSTKFKIILSAYP